MAQGRNGCASSLTTLVVFAALMMTLVVVAAMVLVRAILG